MYCNLRPPEPHQSFPVLITTSPNLSIAVLAFFAADTLLYDVTLTFDPVTLTVDFWPWTFAAYRLWLGETLYQIWTQSNNLRRNIAITVFDLLTLNMF